MLVNVVVEVNNSNLDQPFSYLVDFAMQQNIKIGQKVIVPFGNRNIEAFVLDIAMEYEMSDKYKKVISVSKDFLNEEQLKIIKYLRQHNCATMIECINTILPPALRANIKGKEHRKYIKCLKVIDEKSDLKAKELEVIEFITKTKNPTLTNTNEMFGSYVVTKLRKNNIIDIYEIEEYRLSIDIDKTNYYEELTSDQAIVVNDITSSEELIHLIHGNTGSGKTVCYIELIKKCLSEDKDTLLLVPEISLTTQLVNIISYHFKDDVAVFHSKMSKNEKNDQYRKIIDNKVKIAIGTRSSIFLPFKNLGLIIIDEEHDDSYIQESKVSYSTKEIAAIRSRYHHAKVILGSATPDVSTYYNALNNKIVLHHLVSNYSLSNVKTKMIDMKSNFNWIISSELKNNIIKTVEDSHQFILLLNRRGYANYIICEECGEVYKCPNCEVTLTLHNSNVLKCHHCNYKTTAPKCSCGSEAFNEYGYGLQKVEEVINEELPNIKVARVDTDVLNKVSHVSKIFNEFKNNEYDGLLGTQILSKGLNFTNVNLVAILDADYMLNINSYKSSERTFQYIRQSLGRNARGSDKDCLNLIQSYDLEHYSIKSAVNNDYETFYKQEIMYRKQLNYPPFTKYFKIFATASNLSLLVKYTNAVYLECQKMKLNATKPHFSNIEKINMQYRIQILVKHSHFNEIFGIINKVREYNKVKEINFIVNSNPMDF